LAFYDIGAQHRQLAGAHVKYLLLHRPQSATPSWDKTVAAYRTEYNTVLDGPNLTVLRVY
jgi:hypothetical protein